VARVVLVLGHLPVICEGCCVFPGGAPKPPNVGRHNRD
jgi:hypothetical protein